MALYNNTKVVAVVIPAYKVKAHILGVLDDIGAIVSKIYVVDDCCPEDSGRFILEHTSDPRVTVLFHQENQGVGGAVTTGYKAAIDDGVDIIVKIDGDGQMETCLLPYFIKPLLLDNADYTKGNRFFFPSSVDGMPFKRKFGNIMLSFITKVTTGYWNVFDPTNGYTAIQTKVCRLLPLDLISKRYFFETDMLSHLSLLRAKVVDIPMMAKYGDEVSNLHIQQVVVEFSWKHLQLLLRRLKYQYYINDFRMGSIFLPISIMLLLFGISYALFKWSALGMQGVFASAGQVMIAALPIFLGFQLFLIFLIMDIITVPGVTISENIPRCESKISNRAGFGQNLEEFEEDLKAQRA